MRQFSAKNSPRLSRVFLRAFSLFGFLGIFFSLKAIAAISPPESDRRPTSLLLAKTYEGFQIDVKECDFDMIEGWFYWYIDTSGFCTIVGVANEEEAIRQSNEILEYSFSVIRSGYGTNLEN
jgi:hypothetical protein